MTVLEDRLTGLKTLVLDRGSHSSWEDGQKP
jgi:hypothetical protein